MANIICRYADPEYLNPSDVEPLRLLQDKKYGRGLVGDKDYDGKPALTVR